MIYLQKKNDSGQNEIVSDCRIQNQMNGIFDLRKRKQNENPLNTPKMSKHLLLDLANIHLSI